MLWERAKLWQISKRTIYTAAGWLTPGVTLRSCWVKETPIIGYLMRTVGSGPMVIGSFDMSFRPECECEYVKSPRGMEPTAWWERSFELLATDLPHYPVLQARVRFPGC